MSTPTEPRWSTIRDAAAYSGIPEGTLRRWIHERRLPAIRVGPRRIEVDLNDVDAMRRPIGLVEAPDEHTE